MTDEIGKETDDAWKTMIPLKQNKKKMVSFFFSFLISIQIIFFFRFYLQG